MPDSGSGKRKGAPGGGGGGERGGKRRQGGTGGKWQTPHQKTKEASHRGGGKIEPGDVGIWATCMKGKEGKATEELKVMFEEYAEKFYGIVPVVPLNQDDDEEELDIEASIRAELAAMSNGPNPDGTEKAPKLFQPVYLDVQCVLFFRTAPPIEPLDFVNQICEDMLNDVKSAKEGRTQRKCRFVNRLTPMRAMGRATDKGLEEVGRKVLGEVFELAEKEGEEKEEGTKEEEGGSLSASKENAFSYAIRPTIRNHSTLKRSVVIETIANLISSKHKVDLTKPDKVIIVEIYQTICGLAVVDGPSWEGHLKHFNVFEIYQSGSPSSAANDGATSGAAVSATTERFRAEGAKASGTGTRAGEVTQKDD